VWSRRAKWVRYWSLGILGGSILYCVPLIMGIVVGDSVSDRDYHSFVIQISAHPQGFGADRCPFRQICG
jgi:hypothetical protein